MVANHLIFKVCGTSNSLTYLCDLPTIFIKPRYRLYVCKVCDNAFIGCSNDPWLAHNYKLNSTEKTSSTHKWCGLLINITINTCTAEPVKRGSIFKEYLSTLSTCNPQIRYAHTSTHQLHNNYSY